MVIEIDLRGRHGWDYVKTLLWGAACQLAHLRPPREMAALNLWRLSIGSTSIDELGIEQQAC